MLGILDKVLAGTSAALLAALIGLWGYMHVWALPAAYRAGRDEGVRAERAAAAAELEVKNQAIRDVSEIATTAWAERDAANQAAGAKAESWPLPEVNRTVEVQTSLPKPVLDELNRIR